MAEIRELVLTFLDRLSHHALPKNRKRETLDACIANFELKFATSAALNFERLLTRVWSREEDLHGHGDDT